MTDQGEIQRRLGDAGARLAAADGERKAALEAIGVAMREGHGKMGIKEMSELAGVSRVTAYRLLEDR